MIGISRLNGMDREGAPSTRFRKELLEMAEENGDPAAADEKTAQDRRLRDRVACRRSPTKMQ